jgi:hypothetical protein
MQALSKLEFTLLRSCEEAYRDAVEVTTVFKKLVCSS